MGPLTQSSSGNRYIVVITDLFSKWVEAFPIKLTDSETLAQILVDEVICRYGVSSYLHSDQGANLTSNLMASLCKLLNIQQTRTSAYHPQGNGQVERFNHALKTHFSMLVEPVTYHTDSVVLHLEVIYYGNSFTPVLKPKSIFRKVVTKSAFKQVYNS